MAPAAHAAEPFSYQVSARCSGTGGFNGLGYVRTERSMSEYGSTGTSVLRMATRIYVNYGGTWRFHGGEIDTSAQKSDTAGDRTFGPFTYRVNIKPAQPYDIDPSPKNRPVKVVVHFVWLGADKQVLHEAREKVCEFVAGQG